MSKKSNRRPQPRKGMDLIQIAAIGLIIIVAAVFAWMFLPKGTKANIPSTSAPNANASSVSDQAACKVFDSIPAAAQYDAAPPMKIDAAQKYFATFKMAKGGEFVVQLFADKAPNTVNSFVFLTCKVFYNGVTFHRVLEGFMAQGGDPDGTGMGGPGYQFAYEGSNLKFDKAGVMAMANSGPQTPTNGSQFFITFAPADFLNDGYTIFGQVTDGMDVVNAITRRDPQTHPTFTGDVIESITIAIK